MVETDCIAHTTRTVAAPGGSSGEWRGAPPAPPPLPACRLLTLASQKAQPVMTHTPAMRWAGRRASSRSTKLVTSSWNTGSAALKGAQLEMSFSLYALASCRPARSPPPPRCGQPERHTEQARSRARHERHAHQALDQADRRDGRRRVAASPNQPLAAHLAYSRADGWLAAVQFHCRTPPSKLRLDSPKAGRVVRWVPPPPRAPVSRSRSGTGDEA